MTLTIKIEMDNEAFQPQSGTQVARILKRLAGEIDNSILRNGHTYSLEDTNGNTVGKAKVSR